jgi:hypothetical protein
MRNVTFLLSALLLFVGILNGHGADDKKLEQLMRKKLTHSQKVLEGIVLNDYDKIADNAQELILVSKAAEWRVLKTPQYEMHSNEFRRSAENVVQAAKNKNLDGATLAYMEMTMVCVRCHKHVREVRQARLD